MLSGLTDADEPSGVNNQLIPELIFADYHEGVCQDSHTIQGSHLFSSMLTGDFTDVCCEDKSPVLWCDSHLWGFKTKITHEQFSPQSQVTELLSQHLVQR